MAKVREPGLDGAKVLLRTAAPVRRPPQAPAERTAASDAALPTVQSRRGLTQLQRLVGNRAVVQRIAALQLIRVTRHGVERGRQRGITRLQMEAITRRGARGVMRFYDPAYPAATVYWQAATGWAVCVADGAVITTYRQPRPKARWRIRR